MNRPIIVSLILLVTSSFLFAEPLIVVGRFLKHSSKKTIRMQEQKIDRRYFGWQTSGLAYDNSSGWWSICDQNGSTTDKNSKYPGRLLYRMNLGNGQVSAEPIPIWWRNSTNFNELTNNKNDSLDFESVATDPKGNTLFAVTEGNRPLLIEMSIPLKSQNKAFVKTTVELSTRYNRVREKGQGKKNKRWEGMAVSPNGKTIYLATEWEKAESRIYKISVKKFRATKWSKDSKNKPVLPKLQPTPVEWPGLSKVEGELSGMCFLTYENSEYMLLLERNPEFRKPTAGIYVIAVSKDGKPIKPDKIIVKWTKLELQAPSVTTNEGQTLVSASPEGMATDNKRIMLISDPAPDYYKLAVGKNTEHLSNLIPLVFELAVKDVLKSARKRPVFAK